VTQSRWLAIIVGTLIVAMAFWFAVLTIPSSLTVGLLIFGIGIAFAMYSVAGFSRADDPMGTGFAAALIALGTVTALALFGQTVGLAGVLAFAPVAAIGVGGTRALAPTGDKSRNLIRLGATAAASGIAFFVFTVDITAYGLVAPLLSLPALGIADRVYDRGREVVAEDA
jgi:hypothetical protein